MKRDLIVKNALQLIRQEQEIFRFDTYGDEQFWGDSLRLHKAIEGKRFGGVGDGLSPLKALKLGLKVDVDALPEDVVQDLKAGKVDLNDVAVTLSFIQQNAVLGIKGAFNADGTLKSVGITCALCHSTVNDSVIHGIGHRLDGWANRDLNVGAITALAPNLKPFTELLKIVNPNITTQDVSTVLKSWGPGKFDAELVLDGKTATPSVLTWA